MAIDVRDVASRVQPSGEGFWIAETPTAVSYPSDGNDVCFGLEDGSFWFRHRNRILLEAMRNFPPRGRAVLDVGGGNGFVTRAMQDAGYEAVLIEPNAQGARNAVQRGVRNVISGALESIGLNAAAVGAVALFDVIEHVADDAGFLRGIASQLAAGTRLYATVPAFQSLWSGDDVAAGHFRRYRRASIERVLRTAGFTVEYSSYFFSLLPAPIAAFRVLPWRLGRRARPTSKQLASEHDSAAAVLVERALAWELAAVRRRIAVPVGSSCLVVGSRTD
jgi:SAM-dependent methyltransferase